MTYRFKALLIVVIGISLTGFAQIKEEVGIVHVDSTWGKEIIKFPIEWAPKLALKGFEELRFAPNWKNKEHEDFWTLVMSWNVKTNNKLSLKELQLNLEYYFDGLMKPNHWAEIFPEPKVEFYALNQSENETAFEGQLVFFDGFYTGELLTTYIIGSQLFYEKTKKSIIMFKISSQPFHNPIWNRLNAITLKSNICNN